MTAIPHAAMALTSALDRFGHAGSRVLEAVTGRSDADLGAVASIGVIRFSDEMYKALTELAQEPEDL
jgi:hypothetical protein